MAADPTALFAKRGWIFASVNYRLSRPAAGNARYPDHYDDVTIYRPRFVDVVLA